METRLTPLFRDTASGQTADAILRACVHCGFCLATCPTYLLLGDELDGPRGRIYQIKQVLEGSAATRETQIHLDRCLTCRSCETTCPSGVAYGHLVDIGRRAVADQVRRPWFERLLRWILREGLTRPAIFAGALRLARTAAPILPTALREKIGVARPAGAWPVRPHVRQVLLLKGCIQPALLASIDACTARVLDRIGVRALVAADSGCCGAIHQHLEDQDGARNFFRRNIDAWWPYVEAGAVEAIVINASGCGAMIADYAHLLRDDPTYAAKARRIVKLTQDLAQFLPRQLVARLDSATPSSPPKSAHSSPPDNRAPPVRPESGISRKAQRVVFHSPCSLQHGLAVRGEVEYVLRRLGAELLPVADGHLCCGSAGTYSILQPRLAGELRRRKLEALREPAPDIILSANVGCIGHLQGATGTPVRHWIEWVDAVLSRV